MTNAWESRAEFRRLITGKPDISAHELFGLLDEIAFFEKLFWRLPPGVLISSGASAAVLRGRFGYPGLHVGVDAENTAELESVLVDSNPECVYFLNDLENPETSMAIKQSLHNKGIELVDVFRDLYPEWCAGWAVKKDRSDVQIITAAIICPARSGSTYLSSLLNSTGQFGNVNEHMRHHMTALTRGSHISFSHWWEVIAKAGAANNGVFLTKVIHAFLASTLETADKATWHRWADLAREWKLITITRKDVVARAVSIYVAESTGTWRVNNPMQFEKLNQQAGDVSYDLEKLRGIYNRLIGYDALVEKFVADAGGANLALNFDVLVADGPAATLQIVDLLGGNLEQAGKKIANRKNTPISSKTSQNALFAERLRNDLGLS